MKVEIRKKWVWPFKKELKVIPDVAKNMKRAWLRRSESDKFLFVGYWRSETLDGLLKFPFPNGDPFEDLPHPKDFVDLDWDPNERQKVIEYLEDGYIFLCCMGPSWCRMGCKSVWLGNHDFTDGTWVYPEGYQHYLREHKVKPPPEFLEHIRANNYKMPLLPEERTFREDGGQHLEDWEAKLEYGSQQPGGWASRLLISIICMISWLVSIQLLIKAGHEFLAVLVFMGSMTVLMLWAIGDNLLWILRSRAIWKEKRKLESALRESPTRTEGHFPDLEKAYQTTLDNWTQALEKRDIGTQGHSSRVANLTVIIAKSMGWSEEDITNVREGALLHDIGKLSVPPSILMKLGTLTDEEREIMQKHPVYAAEILKPISRLWPVIPIILYHHENWDGSGYPESLSGQDIPKGARLLAVANAFDIMTHDKPNQSALSSEEAYDEIVRNAGIQFDPTIVETFCRCWERGEIQEINED